MSLFNKSLVDKWFEILRHGEQLTKASAIELCKNFAKAQLEMHPAEFKQLVKKLHYSASYCSKLLKIGQSAQLHRADLIDKLPEGFTQLYALAQLPEATFEEALADGTISPKITRVAVGKLRDGADPVRKPPKHGEHIISVYFRGSVKDLDTLALLDLAPELEKLGLWVKWVIDRPWRFPAGYTPRKIVEDDDELDEPQRNNIDDDEVMVIAGPVSGENASVANPPT